MMEKQNGYFSKLIENKSEPKVVVKTFILSDQG